MGCIIGTRCSLLAFILFAGHVHMRPELRIDMMLEPGDIQLANNHLVLHSRTSFVDHNDIHQRRKLLRLWLKMSNARTPPASFPGRNGFGFPNV